MAQALVMFDRVLGVAELAGGTLAMLFGIANSVSAALLHLSPGWCQVEDGRCIRDVGSLIVVDGLLAVLSVLVAASAYIHVQRHRMFGLTALWVLAALSYAILVLSFGSLFGYTFLFTLGTALIGTFRSLINRRLPSRGLG